MDENGGIKPLWLQYPAGEVDAMERVDSRSITGAGPVRFVDAAEDLRAGLLDLLRFDGGAGRTLEVARLLGHWSEFVVTMRLNDLDDDRWSLIALLEEAYRAQGMEPQKYDPFVLAAFFERVQQAWLALWLLRDEDDGSLAQLTAIGAFFERVGNEMTEILLL